MNEQLEMQEHEASWLEGFWDEMYLNIRDRLPINVNPYFTLKGQWKGRDVNDTASQLVGAIAKFNKAIRSRLLTPDMEGSTPLCMSQYSKLFGGTRFPKAKRDIFSSNRYSRHIIVMRRGQMFSLTVENEQQQLIDPSVLNLQLDKICEVVDQLSNKPAVGYFTCSDREEWAQNYAELEALSERNSANLNMIAGALAVLNLDEIECESLQTHSTTLFHNRGENRWFDKLQLAISSDGFVGFNMEHTPIDGHTLVRLAADVHADLSGSKPYPTSKLLERTNSLEGVPLPAHLEFDLDTSLHEKLEKAKSDFEAFADLTESIPLIEGVGKRFVKLSGSSPDSFIQMAIQLAHFKESGRFDSTYESALTKRFLHGRTETIRSVSEASKAYCNGFSLDNLPQSGALLLEACGKHAQTAKAAKSGFGVDRHLFGLYSLAKQEKEDNADFKIPSIFTSPYYSRYGSNIISTSNCGSEDIGLFGFGPVHPDGVGIGYLILDDSTRLTVSTTNGKGASFAKTLSEAINLQCRAIRASQELK